MNRGMLVGLLVSLLLSAASVTAHENYRIIGTITKVTAEKLDVKQTKDGKTISMFMDKTTKIARDNKPVKAAELKVGLSVVVDAHGDALNDLDVVAVRIVPAPTKK